jgi:hypothetical protein
MTGSKERVLEDQRPVAGQQAQGTRVKVCPVCNRQFDVPLNRGTARRKYCSDGCRRRKDAARMAARRPPGGGWRPGGRAASRQPLPDFAQAAGWQLRKAAERIERVIGDDRFARNREQVVTQIDGHLKYAADTIAQVLRQLHQEG